MELISVIGQYLLMAFVLPGFCYVVVFILCFHGVLGATFPGTLGELRVGTKQREPLQSKDASQGFWISVVAVIGGLLLSSVAFFFELLLRKFALLDCFVFPSIAFEKISEPLPNFIAAQTIMHFNIFAGILVILVFFLVRERPNWYRRPPYVKTYLCDPRLLAGGLAILVVANVFVSSHLFHREARIVYKSDWLVYESKKACQERSHLVAYVPDYVASWP